LFYGYFSYEVRKAIDAHGAVPALVELLKAPDAPTFVKEKVSHPRFFSGFRIVLSRMCHI
jgi:hypothetical protein